MRTRLFLAGLLVALPAFDAQQSPPRDAGAKAATTGRLSGRVTALSTGKPIHRAYVTVTSSTVPGRAAWTDADGHWTIDALPAASYNISISKNGFLTLAYGQRRAFTPGTGVKLAAGEALAKLDVALPRAAAIAGRVVDDLGEAVAGARVSVERHGFYRGQPRLTNVGGTVTTDDLGAFRVYGLPAGEYYVAVTPPTRATAAPFIDRTGFVRTYYPDAHSVSQAARVPLQLGDDVRDLVVTLLPTRMVTLSGTAVDSTGKPVGRGFIWLHERANRMNSSREHVVSDGRWSVTGVVPGDYQLSLQWVDNIEAVAATGSTTGRKREFAEMPITVGGEDIGGIALVTGATGTASGRVRFEGMAPTDAPVAEYVHGVDPTGYSPAGSGKVMPDWTFKVDALSGQRVFRIDGPLLYNDGWILKSVTLRGQDITDAPIATPFGTDIAGLEVTLAKTAAELSGTVTTDKGTPAPEFVVIVFPPEPERWGAHSRQIKTGRPDHTGRFAIAQLPPATYLVAALEYVEPGQEMNPEFLEKLKAGATRVTLGDSEKKAVTLSLTTPNF